MKAIILFLFLCIAPLDAIEYIAEYRGIPKADYTSETEFAIGFARQVYLFANHDGDTTSFGLKKTIIPIFFVTPYVGTGVYFNKSQTNAVFKSGVYLNLPLSLVVDFFYDYYPKQSQKFGFGLGYTY